MLSGTRRRSGAMRSRPRMTSCRMRSRLASGSAKPHSPPSPGPSVALPTRTVRLPNRQLNKRSITARPRWCNAHATKPHTTTSTPRRTTIDMPSNGLARAGSYILLRRPLPASARGVGVGMIVAGELGHERMQSAGPPAVLRPERRETQLRVEGRGRRRLTLTDAYLQSHLCAPPPPALAAPALQSSLF